MATRSTKSSSRKPWSTEHAACIDCSTTERRHYGHGRCNRCRTRHYEKTHKEGRRARQYSYYWRSREKRLAASKAWHERNGDRHRRRLRKLYAEKVYAEMERKVALGWKPTGWQPPVQKSAYRKLVLFLNRKDLPEV